MIRFATASVSCGAISCMSASRLAVVTEHLLAGRALGDTGADRIGERELAAEVVRALWRDAEVGADGEDPVGLR